MTNDLIRRVLEHKEKIHDGFTKKYNVTQLIHYEEFSNIVDAIEREKNLKKWKRDWKIELIEEENPDWKDVFDEVLSSS